MKLLFLTLGTLASLSAHPIGTPTREAGPTPLAKSTFSKKGLANGEWSRFGADPAKAHYKFRGRTLEMDSLEVASDGMAFIHRFPKIDQEPIPQLFGRAPTPEPQRLILDAEIMVLEERHVSGGLAGVHLNVEDHHASSVLLILEDGIFLYRHAKVHKMDTTDRWHHYRFVVDGDWQRIYVDDMETPVFEIERPKQAGRHWASFGDSTAGAGASARFRKVRFSRYRAAAIPK